MGELYGDMETRVPVTLDPVPEDALDEIALWGARTGARGGTLAGRGLRGAVGAASRLPGDPIPQSPGPLIFRGLSGEVADPLSPRPGYAAFASNNPSTALSYAGDPRIKDVLGDPSTGRGAAVHPIRLSPQSLREHEDMLTAAAEYGKGRPGSFDRFVFDDYARWTGPRSATVVRGVYDAGPRLTGEGGRAAGFRHDSYGWPHPEGLASPASAPMSPDEVAGLMHRSAERAGLEGSRFSGDSGLARATGTAEWPESERFSQDELDRVIREIPNDPLFRPAKPPLASRIGKGLLRFGKGALHPAGILADALLGSAAGGGSAAAGYASASPETAGTLSIPSGSDILGEIPSDPLRGGVVGQETMLRAIMAADERKEALRQQYIDEINAQYGPGTVQQGAKIDEISRYLGPVDF